MAAVTYRNSCLAVLVGDVGKSSSLCKWLEEKAGERKGKKSRREGETGLRHHSVKMLSTSSLVGTQRENVVS